MIDKITTTDVFGVKLEISNGRVNDVDPVKRWDLFSLSQQIDPTQNADDDFLYIPPSTGFREESEPLENVLFIRDENSNLVWGIEKTGTNAWGKPVPVAEKHIEKKRKKDEADGDTTQPVADQNPALFYKLATKVPEHWIPYLPQRVSGTLSEISLKQARLPRVDADIIDGDEVYTTPSPTTRVLQESTVLNEESITRAGVMVKLTRQRLRWIDGKTYVWLGRNVTPGRGEGSSGLKFDVIENRK